MYMNMQSLPREPLREPLVLPTLPRKIPKSDSRSSRPSRLRKYRFFRARANYAAERPGRPNSPIVISPKVRLAPISPAMGSLSLYLFYLKYVNQRRRHFTFEPTAGARVRQHRPPFPFKHLSTKAGQAARRMHGDGIQSISESLIFPTITLCSFRGSSRCATQ